ncbi:MAG TPA: SusD/RagB family nutrient-binding outer membrane lipoprotein, partial [Hanamia sp.]|nr:SusD/RagB family nutrient-binding outer membrane lipoprotein [Hanamia sp.]
MKNRILLQVKITVCWVLFLAIFWTGCTKKSFEDRNIDPTRLTSLSPSDVKSLFPSAEYAGMNTGPGSVDYQQAQNLFADMFCQYFAGTQTAFSSLRYVIQQSWVTYQWRSTYLYAMPALVNIIKETKTPETITLNAIARIWKVFVLHRTTDYFGPIPYSNIGVASTSIPYDSQQSIYMDFFKELNEAANDLKNNLNVPSYGVQDVIFNGDNAKWLKFANTLRLRLALRISDVEPAMAQQEADSALANGIMTDFSDDAYLAVSAPNDYNGLSRIASWNEFRMSANMQSLLVGYNDPRLSKFFQPAV